MNSKQYRIFERVRVAILLAFISGFVDAYTFMTQGQRFAGMQTGNMIYLMKHLAEGHILTAASYLLPIVAFMLGSLFTYFARRFAVRHILRFFLSFRPLSATLLRSQRHLFLCR